MTPDEIKALIERLRECSWARATISPELKPQWTGDDAPERAATALTDLSDQLAAKLELVTLLRASLAKSERALEAINTIRNSIIGLQTLNWSEHVYPLVAALDAAGVEGMEYPKGREFFGTMLDRCNAAEDDAGRYRWIRSEVLPFKAYASGHPNWTFSGYGPRG